MKRLTLLLLPVLCWGQQSGSLMVGAWDGSHGPASVKAANTSPALNDVALTTVLSPSNTGLPVNIPAIVQKANAVTSVAGKTVAPVFASNTIKGNSIIAVCGSGNWAASNWAAAVTDTQSNTYLQAAIATQSTTQAAMIFYTTGIAGGADTVTLTISGTSSANTALACEIYEVSGLIAVLTSKGILNETNTGSNAGSTSVSAGAVTPVDGDDLTFVAIAAAGGTITAGSDWTLDSGTLAPTGGNLVSFGSESQILTQVASYTGNATLSVSNAWAAAIAGFTGVALHVQGTVAVNSVPANMSVNISQVAGSTAAVGATGILKVAVTDGSGTAINSTSNALNVSVQNATLAVTESGTWNVGSSTATGSAVPANAFYLGGNGSGNLTGFVRCDTNANINQTANTQVITGTSAKKIYICEMNLTTATAQNIAVVEGTGTTCATSTVAFPGTSGGASAATGWNLAANSGVVLGGGIGPIGIESVAADNVCIFQSSTGQVSGSIWYTVF